MNISKESAFFRFLKVLYGFWLGLIMLLAAIFIYFSFQGLGELANTQILANIESASSISSSSNEGGSYKPTLADIEELEANQSLATPVTDPALIKQLEDQSSSASIFDGFKLWIKKAGFILNTILQRFFYVLVFFIIGTVILDILKSSILYILYSDKFSINSFVIIQVIKKLDGYSKKPKRAKNLIAQNLTCSKKEQKKSGEK